MEGTLFALLMSGFNGAGILGTELGALLTQLLGVTADEGGATDFTNLGLLVTICNLSSLLPLLALNWLDAAPPAALTPTPSDEPGAADADDSVAAGADHDNGASADADGPALANGKPVASVATAVSPPQPVQPVQPPPGDGL